ncbi:hypothetical protein F5Y18DRAFT_94675 [Xylariaceae sp. FL1019]|nr:hypothetical protein F5Y18DRAFT_94675 [Xylariaceae sp. FL1019]
MADRRDKAFDRGAFAGHQNIDAPDPDPNVAPRSGINPLRDDGGDDKGLLGSLKDALKPGDLKRDDDAKGRSGPFGRDDRGGSLMDKMMPGRSDPSDRSATGGGPGILDKLTGRSDPTDTGKTGFLDKLTGSAGWDRDAGRALGLDGDPKAPRGYDPSRRPGDPRAPGRDAARRDDDPGNYRYDSLRDPRNDVRPHDVGDRATPRTSPLDREGAVGHEFTADGSIGGTADKIGGPFSKDGVIGRQFTDSGTVGGSVQDTAGHGDATRKGR